MGNVFNSNYDWSKIDNADTVFLIGKIISGISFIVYIPILIVFLSKPLTRIKVIQYELIFCSIGQSISYLMKPLNNQEYLCITKGPFNVLTHFILIALSTVIVYVAYSTIQNPNNNRITWPFVLAVTAIGQGIPIMYLLIHLILFEYFYFDYNHPCKIHHIRAVILFFSMSYIFFIINIGYVIKTILGINQFIKDYPEETIGVLFKKRLVKYLIWTLWIFVVFIIKFVFYFFEYNQNVIRNFPHMLAKYIVETTSGALYVLIYCYTHNTLNKLFSLCKKKKKSNEHSDEHSDKLISMIVEQKDSTFSQSENIDSMFNNNDTIY